jgi:hypothetical protein
MDGVSGMRNYQEFERTFKGNEKWEFQNRSQNKTVRQKTKL